MKYAFIIGILQAVPVKYFSANLHRKLEARAVWELKFVIKVKGFFWRNLTNFYQFNMQRQWYRVVCRHLLAFLDLQNIALSQAVLHRNISSTSNVSLVDNINANAIPFVGTSGAEIVSCVFKFTRAVFPESQKCCNLCMYRINSQVSQFTTHSFYCFS